MMTTKTINSYYTSGYTIADGNNLYITNRGGVGPSGILAGYNTTITTEGFVNGGPSDGGIGMNGGGAVRNGSSTYTGAEIRGFYGVRISGAYGSVSNFGVIEGIDSYSGFGDGVDLDGGGVVRNGSAGSRYAVIEGATGVSISYAAGEVYNFGFIKGVNSDGVALSAGGSVRNGSNTDATATIEGYTGVGASAGANVVNYGTIAGDGAGGADAAIFLADGGSVTNGTAGDHTALIQGAAGIIVSGAAGYVSNAGTIRATGNAFGVEMISGGALTNGSLNNPGALIQGYAGVDLYGATHAVNFGTISGTGDFGIGVRLGDGASITNGAAGHTLGLIEDYLGVYGDNDQAATVTNFGTIIGTGGTAVELASTSAVLNVGAGSAFVGAVTGGGGTLDLLSGTGTITGLFAAGGDVTVSGSMTKTTFQNFGTVVVSAGATFTDTGAVTLAAGQVVNDAGTLNLTSTGKVTNAGLIETTGAGVLTIAGSLVNTGTIGANGGTLVIEGAVTGAGSAAIDGGTLDLASSFNEAVRFTTTGVLELAKSTTYTASITGFSKTGKTSLDLVDIGFVSSTEATFSGTTTSGVLTVTDGTHTAHIKLTGNYTTSTFIASSDGHGGTIVVDPKAKAAAISPAPLVPTPHSLIAAMAALGGAASVTSVHTNDTFTGPSVTLTRPHSPLA
jgi:hypothetical protein